ncbi:hypothetical protein J3F84DRAFT_354508 [Trichoderma pleuroticola]
MDVDCPVLLITNIKPLRRRIQAESLPAGFPGAKSQSAQHLWPFSYHGPRQQRHRLCQDARTHGLIDGMGAIKRLQKKLAVQRWITLYCTEYLLPCLAGREESVCALVKNKSRCKY